MEKQTKKTEFETQRLRNSLIKILKREGQAVLEIMVSCQIFGPKSSCDELKQCSSKLVNNVM